MVCGDGPGGVERRLFAQAGATLHRASWNPVRLSHHGTVETGAWTPTFPEMVLASAPHPWRCREGQARATRG